MISKRSWLVALLATVSATAILAERVAAAGC
jgi:hypothetical protein